MVQKDDTARWHQTPNTGETNGEILPGNLGSQSADAVKEETTNNHRTREGHSLVLDLVAVKENTQIIILTDENMTVPSMTQHIPLYCVLLLPSPAGSLQVFFLI